LPGIVSRFFRRYLLLCSALCLLCTLAAAQAQSGTQTVMVMPFENQSSVSGLEWISEAFPEVLSQRMAAPRLYVIDREARSYAFDHAGIPAGVHPSRATIYQIAEKMDADYVVFGTYTYDGTTFSTTAQLLDMKKLHLSPAVQSSGPLTDLIQLQTLQAWQLLQQIPSAPRIGREQFLKASPPIRLDAFENYIRGILATGTQQKVHYYRKAISLNPNYTLAVLQLGKTYYQNHEYEAAASWFNRVPKNDAAAGEANFLLGLSEFYRGNLDKSFAAFSYLATRLPLTEIYNNLGVVESRRGRRTSAVEYLSKAVNADPSDADYRFNLGVALFKTGDATGAARQLREELQSRPNDAEAKSLLDLINRGGTVQTVTAASTAPVAGNALVPSSAPRIPMERIKRNYDESSYRQLELEIHNLTEVRLAKTDGGTHAAYHIQRGKELLALDMPAQAETEFRDAVAADGNSAVAHAQLAAVLEKKGDAGGARAEAQTSVHLQPNVDALLVLARLDVTQNQWQSATGEVDRALTLEPANAAALALKRDIAARQTVSK
jgi:tetratricopeptide (TPR) repeat protein